MLSTIITAHNEGDEVRRTVESVATNTRGRQEIIVVDDGSTDDCCSGLPGHVRVFRNEARQGVAPSRDLAVQQAHGDAFAFLDGHQRVSVSALNRCAAYARQHSAIIFPDIRGFGAEDVVSHGAHFELCPEHGYFSSRWDSNAPTNLLTRVTSLRAPAYVIPASVYDRVRWIRGLRNWGGSESAVSLKAFFTGVPILHLCGTMTHHRFKKALHYDATWCDVWRNHALIARVCFDDRSWNEYWMPKVFDSHLTDETINYLDSEEVVTQHRDFQRIKACADDSFWTQLLNSPVPEELTKSSGGRC